MKSRKQTGFTLVEIAIVLVVIGLLLGGILKGQQLINSARVRNLADQSSGVQAAYYGFIDRFRNLPGDMTPANACQVVGQKVDSANCATPANAPGGNGDGRITTVAEAGAVWPHLSTAGFLTGTYTGQQADGTTNLTAATYLTAVASGGVPGNAFQGPILLAHMSDYIDTLSTARASVVRLAYSFGGNIPVPILRDLDQKLDNGVAGTGVMVSAVEKSVGTAATFGAVTDYDATTGDDCLADVGGTATWFVDSNNQTCNAIFLF
jgi:prepilin-type N-terminal cleavage/methylation domain-containing protein